jgi:hypothetical protein
LFLARQTFEEISNVGLEKLRDLLQPARADPIRALLVFLNLLEGQSEGLAELFLAETEKHAAQPNATANMPVDVIGRLFHSKLLAVARRMRAAHETPSANIAAE